MPWLHNILKWFYNIYTDHNIPTKPVIYIISEVTVRYGTFSTREDVLETHKSVSAYCLTVMTATKFSHFSYQADKTLGCRELFLPHLQTCTTVREGEVEPHSDLFCITDMCSRGGVEPHWGLLSWKLAFQSPAIGFASFNPHTLG